MKKAILGFMLLGCAAVDPSPILPTPGTYCLEQFSYVHRDAGTATFVLTSTTRTQQSVLCLDLVTRTSRDGEFQAKGHYEVERAGLTYAIWDSANVVRGLWSSDPPYLSLTALYGQGDWITLLVYVVEPGQLNGLWGQDSQSYTDTLKAEWRLVAP